MNNDSFAGLLFLTLPVRVLPWSFIVKGVFPIDVFFPSLKKDITLP